MLEELLKRLDEMDWRSVNHAYGPADDIPELIRRSISEPDMYELLYSDDENAGDIWNTATWTLSNNLIHQGTISEAVSYTIPFLSELLSYKTIQNRRGVSEILLEAALSGYSDLSNSARTDDQKRYQNYIKKTHEALSKEAGAYLQLLTDEDAHIRLNAATILSYFTLYSNEIVPALHKFLMQETNPEITDYFYEKSKFIPELKQFYLQWQPTKELKRERSEPT